MKAHFLKLQIQPVISQTLYELGTSGLAYSTLHNQYLLIFALWLGVKSKLFSREKNMKKVKKLIFWNSNSTSDFSDST